MAKHHKSEHEGSYSFFNISLSERLSDELARLHKECAYPNWDAYDAEPLLPETIEKAHEFLAQLPNTLRTPEAFVDPTGELFFEWKNEENDRAVAFVNQIGRISFSVSQGGEPIFGHGYLPDIPKNLIEFLEIHFNR